MIRLCAKEGPLLLIGVAGFGYPPFLQGGGTGWSGTTSYAVLNVTAVALLFVIAVVAAIRVRALRLPAAVCVAGLAAAAVVWFHTLANFPIPAAWLTPLSYSSELVNIDEIYGHNTHAGPNFAFLASTLAHGAPSLREIVRMNLGLALVDAALLLGIAQRVAGKGWGLVFTALFVCNVLTMHTSLSEGAGNLLTAYRFARVLAFLLIGDLTLLAACTRLESSTAGVIALLVFLASTAIPAKTRHAPGRRRKAYYGTDCNLLRSDGCGQFIAGRAPIEETQFERNPYQESFYDTTGPAVRLATYAYRMSR